jgi:hypothetical protein
LLYLGKKSKDLIITIIQMTDAQLEDKAVDIKGKKYILVSDRILYFNANYPNGSINTELISSPDADMVVMKATVIPDTDKPERKFTGHSQATWGEGFINKTSALENCETSCVGRGLAMLGIGVIDSVASVDEINKAQTSPGRKEAPLKSLVASISKIETPQELEERQDKFRKNKELFTPNQQQEIAEAFLAKTVELEEHEG